MFEGLDATTAAPLVLALSAFVGSLTFGVKACTPEVVKLIGAIREAAVKLLGAIREALTVRAIVKTADAHAQRLAAEERRLEAEERRLAAENTGQFIVASKKDREQIDSFMDEMRSARAEIDECRKGRAADKAEREEERKKHRSEMVAVEARLAGVEASRDALVRELREMHRSINSGGAYAPPLRREES